jgi:helix-turn-helix protein
MRAAMPSEDGNQGYGAMQRKSANQSGEGCFSHGSLSAATQSMSTFQTPLTASTSDQTQLRAGDIAYYRERQRNRVFEAVWAEFVNQAETAGLTKKMLAERLGKHPSQITRWFSGPANWELDTISDLFLAMNCEMTIGCSSLLNWPTPNYVHPAAITNGTWISPTGQTPPINFGIDGGTISTPMSDDRNR